MTTETKTVSVKTNGVDVDGMQIEERAYLQGDNHVEIGDFTLVLEWKGIAVARPSEESSLAAMATSATKAKASSTKEEDSAPSEELLEELPSGLGLPCLFVGTARFNVAADRRISENFPIVSI